MDNKLKKTNNTKKDGIFKKKNIKHGEQESSRTIFGKNKD
ncbi:CPC_1213 family protein [Haloimpatiens sp. FM7315]